MKKIARNADSQRGWKKNLMPYLLSFCGIAFAVQLLFFPPAFLCVQEVVFKTPLKHLHEMDVVRLAQVRRGAPLLTLRLQKIRDNIRRYTWVKEVNLSKQIPGRLVIDVEEQVPVALLELEALYLVNKEGVIFKKLESGDSSGDSGDLPVITGLRREKNESLVTPVKKLVMLIQFFEDSLRSIDLSEVHQEDHGDLVLLTQEPVIKILLGKEKWEERIQKFAQAWPTIRETAHHPQVIRLESERRLVVKQNSISKKEVLKDG